MHQLRTKLIVIMVATLLISTMAAGTGYFVGSRSRPAAKSNIIPRVEVPDMLGDARPYEFRQRDHYSILLAAGMPAAVFNSKGVLLWADLAHVDTEGLGWALREIYLSKHKE